MSERTCTSCGHTGRASCDFYRIPAWRNRRARWDSWCKGCRRAAAHEGYRHGGWVDAMATRALLVWLLERGYTKVGLAAAVGCDPTTLRAVLRGQQRVRQATAERVRRLADETAQELAA